MAVIRDVLDAIMHRRSSALPDSDLFSTFTPYALTAAESAASVTPTNYAYAPEPISDVRRYGWSASNTAAQNATALTAAISVRTAAGGGIIQLPAGSFAITDSIVIPQYVTVRGVGGTNGTTLTSSSTGNPAFLLGGTISGVFKYGCGLTDVQIILSNGNGKAIQLMECVQGVVRNIYIQGPISAGRSTKGVVIDGGNIGSFFNLIENVECSHIHVGFDQLTSGSQAPTTNIFINISGVGDYSDATHPDTTSIGYRLSGHPNTGNGTVVLGSDFEQCGWCYYYTAGCASSTHFGIRSENTPGNPGSLDVLLETGAGAQTFIGGVLDIPDGKVVVNSVVALNTTNGSGIPHRFWGIANGSNLPNPGWWAGSNFFYGAQSGDTPCVVVAAPGDTTSKVIQVQNSAGTVLASTDASGHDVAATLTINAATPTGAAATVSFGNTTTGSATAGTAGAVPAQVAGYLTIDIAGTKFKLPYFNV